MWRCNPLVLTMPQNGASQHTVGIIGLGLVGNAIAARLQKAGYRCVGHDVDMTAQQRFATQFGSAVASSASLAAQVDTVILAVFNTDQVLHVVEGTGGLLSGKSGRARHLKTIIDCSTGDPVRLRALALRLHEQSVDLIEAPLSGSSAQIAAGEATLLLGGSPESIAKAAELLKAISAKQIQVGAVGMGARAKLATNLVLGLNRAVLAEGMVFARALGIEPAKFLELVLATPARSDAALAKGQKMVQEDFAPQSRIRQHLKDVELMLALAKQQNQGLPLSETHARLMQTAVQAGDGDLDNAAILRTIKDWPSSGLAHLLDIERTRNQG